MLPLPLVRCGVTAALFVAVLAGPSLSGQSPGVKKRRPLPHEYGNVLMNAASEAQGEAPVVFPHWLHRTRFTCRLCHVDLGFAMQANATGVREKDNQGGFYCGACHDGKTAFGAAGKSSVRGEELRNCARCHAAGRNVPLAADFRSLTDPLPRGRFGNNVDWVAAEKDGRLQLVDTLPGISIRRKPLEVPKDYDIEAKVESLPEIVFSHGKHAVWSGCELCHPDIFAVKRGASKYTMQDIFGGRYCGLCHGTVAFPAIDCQRCHTKAVVAGAAQ